MNAGTRAARARAAAALGRPRTRLLVPPTGARRARLPTSPTPTKKPTRPSQNRTGKNVGSRGRRRDACARGPGPPEAGTRPDDHRRTRTEPPSTLEPQNLPRPNGNDPQLSPTPHPALCGVKDQTERQGPRSRGLRGEERGGKEGRGWESDDGRRSDRSRDEALRFSGEGYDRKFRSPRPWTFTTRPETK